MILTERGATAALTLIWQLDSFNASWSGPKYLSKTTFIFSRQQFRYLLIVAL